MSMDELVEQVDRDRSADFMFECAPFLSDCGMKNSVELALRQHFARHRRAAIAACEATLRAECDKDAFTRGYLIAVSTMMHQHGEDVIAEDCLGELGETEGVLKRLGMDDFDAKPLRKLFREISRKSRYRQERAAAIRKHPVS